MGQMGKKKKKHRARGASKRNHMGVQSKGTWLDLDCTFLNVEDEQ